jgi:V/A-type H+-transporting ATPase subunit I
VLARQYLRWLHDKQAVREAMQRTRSTVIAMGWLPKNRLHTLESALERALPQSALFKIKPDENEESPILLNNPAFLKPFESVTALYGLPQSSEMDPTPMLSFFFILFFGLCLTDAGYGLVLAIAMGLFIWAKKLSIEEGRLWWLLLIGGIVTFFVSIPFGGWFGLTPDKVPSIFTVDTNGDGIADLFKGQIWNLGETKGIAFLQNLSIALGLIHLSFGIFLAGVSKWISGQKAAAFWVDWTTLILFVTIGTYFFVPPEMQSFALYGIYAALALVIWGKGYGSSFFLRPLFGVLGLVNLAMGMLSNTLSYLRLLALGLVTGGLALAVNLVGGQIGGLLPVYLAIPVVLVIYLFGHLVNIALNTLGAFIHSGRLQFVEFFSQFFEGGGRPFQPFKRSLPSAS